MYFTIQKLIFDSSGCYSKSGITRYIFDSSNYSKKIIDSLCVSNLTNRCISQINNSYLTICNNLSYIPDTCNPVIPDNPNYQNDTCVMQILLSVLIIILLFIFYKGCCQEFTDNSCIQFKDKMFGVKISKPSFRFHNKHNKYSEI